MIIDVLEENGFSVIPQGDGWFISQWTPAGEDWGFSVDKLDDIKQVAEGFDPEEELEAWIDARRSGVAGVPPTGTLWEDQLWKQAKLKKVAEELG